MFPGKRPYLWGINFLWNLFSLIIKPRSDVPVKWFGKNSTEQVTWFLEGLELNLLTLIRKSKKLLRHGLTRKTTQKKTPPNKPISLLFFIFMIIERPPVYLFLQRICFRVVQILFPIGILYLALLSGVLKDGKALAIDFPSSSTFLNGSTGLNFPLYANRQDKEGIFRTAKIRRVVDGDTVEFYGGERVRYIGIDAPELKKKIGKRWVEAPEPFGRSAFLRNRGLVEGREVQYEVDQEKRDDYQRLLVYLYVDGIMVNALLVREGLASVMLYPPNIKHAERLLSLQREAWEGKRGIWSGLKEY